MIIESLDYKRKPVLSVQQNKIIFEKKNPLQPNIIFRAPWASVKVSFFCIFVYFCVYFYRDQTLISLKIEKVSLARDL